MRHSTTGEMRNVDPSIVEELEGVKDNPQLDVTKLASKTIIRVKTKNTLYKVVVIDPAKGEVAVQGDNKYFNEPELALLRGASFGGNITKVGFIVVGMRLDLNPASGGFFYTSDVQEFTVEENAGEADRITAAAEEKGPAPVSEEVQLRSLDSFIKENFSPAVQPRITEFAIKFSPNGQVAIVSLLTYAEEAGKFEEAMGLLGRFYEEHWKFQHPEVCGNPSFSRANAEYLERAYAELGLAPPHG